LFLAKIGKNQAKTAGNIPVVFGLITIFFEVPILKTEKTKH